ncbi:MAG: protein kinase [Pirellulaceae bacterium]|nr:protein kinase [Pirellulaceae bacterium]
MPPSQEDASRDDPRLNEILARYLQAVESGQPIDREQFLREHPEYADELREFFADKSQLDELAGRDPRPLVAMDAPTLPPESATRVDAPTSDSVATANTPPRPGSIIRYFGDYELLEEIARGGMGVVYKARQVKLNRIVALKMILSGQLASKEDVQRFYTEAEAAAGLDHQGIVPIFEVGEYDGQHFFSMGFIAGASLSSKIADCPFAPRLAADLIGKVARALQYAHDKGVIHRDLKPANVLLDKDGQPKVTDFGLAKKLDHDSNLTGTGQILGTPSYMPPEQAAGRLSEVRETADVYSLGAILYAALTGRPPFQADNPLDTLMQVLEREPVSPRTLNPTVPRDLETICLKCLEKDRRRRYQSAGELRDELQRFLDGHPILARPISRSARLWRWCKRNPVVASLSSAVVVSLIAGTMVSTWFAMEARQRADAEAEQRRASEHNAATLHLERSLSRCQPDDPAAGLLWLTRSLAEAQRIDDSRLEELCRLQLAAWSRGVHPIHAILPSGPVRAAAFSGDGKTILTTLDGSAIQRWDAASGAPCGEWSRLSSDAMPAGATFDSAGRIVAVSRLDHAVQCFDPETGAPIGPALRHSARQGKTMQFVAFSPGGDRLLSISEDNSVRLWEIAIGESVEVIAPNTDRRPRTAAFSPDGRLLLISLVDQILSCDAATGDVLGPIEPLGKWLNGMAFSPDGTRLLTASSTTAQLWDTKSWRPIGASWPIRAAINDQVQVAFSHDGTLAATGDRDAVRIHDVVSGLPVGAPLRLRFQSSSNSESILALVFSPDDSLLFAGGDSTAACIWRVASRRDNAYVLTHPGVLRGAFSPDSRVLATGSQRDGVRMWNVDTGQPYGPKLEIPGAVWALAFDLTGRRIVAGGNSRTARVWSVETGAPLTPLIQHGNFVTNVAFAGDGQSFWATSRDGRVHHWNVTTGQPLGNPQAHDGNGHVLVRKNGTAILCQSSQLLDLERGTPIGSTLQTGGWAVLHPDERTLWTGGPALVRMGIDTGNVIGQPVTIPGRLGFMGRDGGQALVINDGDGTAVWFDLYTRAAVGPQIDLHGTWRGASATMGVVPLIKPAIMEHGPPQVSPDDRLLVIGTNRDVGGSVQFFDLVSGQQIGPPWMVPAHVQRVGFSPDGLAVLVVLKNGTALLEPAMQPLAGELNDVVRHVEALTGSTLANGNVVRPLDPQEWTERLQRTPAT